VRVVTPLRLDELVEARIRLPELFPSGMKAVGQIVAATQCQHAIDQLRRHRPHVIVGFRCALLDKQHHRRNSGLRCISEHARRICVDITHRYIQQVLAVGRNDLATGG
jgi:hypothetical protein